MHRVDIRAALAWAAGIPIVFYTLALGVEPQGARPDRPAGPCLPLCSDAGRARVRAGEDHGDS